MTCVSLPAADQARHALSRHVPDMAHGFVIRTRHGYLVITADESRRCPQIRQAIESLMRLRLHEAAQGGA